MQYFFKYVKKKLIFIIDLFLINRQ